MTLRYDMRWHFNPPTEGIPDAAVAQFMSLAKRVTAEGDKQSILETFKAHFSIACDRMHHRSSNAGWAESDLQSMMDQAAPNAPRFIEAFYQACEEIRRQSPAWMVPDFENINCLLQAHQINFEIRPPDLVFLGGDVSNLVPVPPRPPTLAERAQEIFQLSLQRSEQNLSERRWREAVQELLWLLESVTTGFAGMDTAIGKVEGKYFNQIVRDLRNKNRGSTLECALNWVTALHGYLSSPTGGGVRHGLDLKSGVAMNEHEARLCANLIRSYLTYLLAEYEAMSSAAVGKSTGYNAS